MRPTFEQIERENKEWWPTHCEALRQGRADILTADNREDLGRKLVFMSNNEVKH
ncbi:hypothetical protein ACVLD2_002172 [Paenibacillus sp. PvR052]